MPGVQGGLRRGGAGPAAPLQSRLPQQLHRALAGAGKIPENPRIPGDNPPG